MVTQVAKMGEGQEEGSVRTDRPPGLSLPLVAC